MKEKAVSGTSEVNAPAAEGQAAASNKLRIPALHTLRGDITEYIKEKDISLTEIAAQTARQRRFRKESIGSKRFFVLAAIFVLLVAGFGFGGWYVFLREKPASEKTALQTPKPIIVSEKQEIITLKSENLSELVDSIRQKIDSPVALGAILDIPILLETAGKKEFLKTEGLFNILEITPPANATQALEGSFGLGVYYLKKNVPFIVLKIRSFELAVSGMLEWEKKLSSDLAPILFIKNKALISKKFQDGILKNHDVRMLYDASNNLIIAYAFINTEYLLITTDFDTIEEIFRRFPAS
ncbi:MAG: hypothetical protein COV90_02585 [Candidatus Tagabacteria bacterium CG11_big_fil_rev_8_21_14_0_20_41_11]|nr:MAG: hypothetical protein COV90_02585 [Candidatus Tagabacteria bacterium CG11_big_fil_rev_8_21_14_0_20_41_11]